jgi:CubicO group peptidase (beta-lactamase class C family)
MNKKKGIPGIFIFGVAATLLLSACETQSSLTRRRIKDVERGLLRKVFLKGIKNERLSLKKRMKFYGIPGLSLAVMDRGRLEWSKVYGIKDSRGQDAVTKDTVFQAGALSQPMAASASLRLVDRGNVGLDSDISGILRDWNFPKSVRITLRDLLSNNAGLHPQEFPGYPRNAPLPDIISLLDGREPAANRPVFEDWKPGEFRFSEAGYLVVQKLLADVEEKPFPEVMKEVIFNPLGLESCSFSIPPTESPVGKEASGHILSGDPVAGKWFNYPESGIKGLWTTAVDYASFLIRLVEDAKGESPRILTPASARLMFTPQFGNFGFGFFLEGGGKDLCFSRRGETKGYSSFAVVYPGLGQGVVILTNSDNGRYLADEIVRAVSEVYRWPGYKSVEKTVYKLDRAIMDQYAGSYEITSDYFLDVSCGDYFLSVKPTGQSETKFYADGETLFFSTDPYIQIQFRKDGTGRVAGLVLWQGGSERKARKIS